MIIVQAKAIPKDETSKNRIIKAAENLIEKSKSEKEILTITYIQVFKRTPYFL